MLPSLSSWFWRFSSDICHFSKKKVLHWNSVLVCQSSFVSWKDCFNSLILVIGLYDFFLYMSFSAGWHLRWQQLNGKVDTISCVIFGPWASQPLSWQSWSLQCSSCTPWGVCPVPCADIMSLCSIMSRLLLHMSESAKLIHLVNNTYHTGHLQYVDTWHSAFSSFSSFFLFWSILLCFPFSEHSS